MRHCFVYRSPIARERFNLLLSAKGVRKNVAYAHRSKSHIMEFEDNKEDGIIDIKLDPKFDYTPLEKYFDQHLEQAKFYAEALGWDGTVDDIKCFVVPTFEGALYGFVIPQVSTKETFIVSPIELLEFEARCDFDGKTNSEEVLDTQLQMEGKPRKINKIDPFTTTSWATSQKGNLYRKINNVQCIVMPSKRGAGYTGMIVSADEQKIFTPTQKTETEACQYLTTNFFTMIEEWRPGK